MSEDEGNREDSLEEKIQDHWPFHKPTGTLVVEKESKRIAVFTRIASSIEEGLGLEKRKVMEGDTFQSLLLDSLDVIELLMDLEIEFNMEFPDNIADGRTSVKDIVDYVEANYKGAL